MAENIYRSDQLEGICAPQVNDAVQLTVHQFAESLGNAIDAKDHCTHSHSEEVAVVSQMIGQKLGLPPQQADILHVAGHLHDIGKIGIPGSILRKSGKLTREEYLLVKKHPEIGADIIRPVTSFAGTDGIVNMVLHHHEHYDGRGYPHGLRGRAIPLGARIIAVADALSAMLQDRPYREPFGFDQAVREILDHTGTQFDPFVVKGFMEIRGCIGDFFELMKQTRMAI